MSLFFLSWLVAGVTKFAKRLTFCSRGRATQPLRIRLNADCPKLLGVNSKLMSLPVPAHLPSLTLFVSRLRVQTVSPLFLTIRLRSAVEMVDHRLNTVGFCWSQFGCDRAESTHFPR